MKLAQILLLLCVGVSAAAEESLEGAFDRDVLIIEASKHACYRFDIWLAIERQQQLRGLMNVRDMGEMSGMLFVYPDASHQSMWMKNTYISLDIAFARSDGSITNIVENTEPLSLKSISSTDAVNYVLELNAGTAQRLSIDENSRLLWEPTVVE